MDVTAACNANYHHSCPGSVWNGVDLMHCECLCHPRIRNGCAQGAHDLCHHHVFPFMICDCPCHFMRARVAVLELRARLS